MLQTNSHIDSLAKIKLTCPEAEHIHSSSCSTKEEDSNSMHSPEMSAFGFDETILGSASNSDSNEGEETNSLLADTYPMDFREPNCSKSMPPPALKMLGTTRLASAQLNSPRSTARIFGIDACLILPVDGKQSDSPVF